MDYWIIMDEAGRMHGHGIGDIKLVRGIKIIYKGSCLNHRTLVVDKELYDTLRMFYIWEDYPDGFYPTIPKDMDYLTSDQLTTFLKFQGIPKPHRNQTERQSSEEKRTC